VLDQGKGFVRYFVGYNAALMNTVPTSGAQQGVLAALNQRGIGLGHCCFCHLEVLRVGLSTILAKGLKFQHR
jgi:hypothetical protein